MQGKDENDNGLVLIIAGLAAVVGIFLITRIFAEQVNTVYAKFKIYETWAYSFWSQDWSDLTNDILAGKRDLGAVRMSVIGKFYNRYASIFWLIIYGLIFWRLKKMEVRDDWMTHHNPQSLLATTSRMFSATAPWVYHDPTKANWNVGKWRLMESPLMFLVKHRAILDPNGEPFRWDLVFDCGNCEALYAPDVRKDGSGDDDTDERSIFEIAQAEIERRRSVAGKIAKDDFELPSVELGAEEEEIEKFRTSSLVPLANSIYLNTKEKIVVNSLNIPRLQKVLSAQVGDRLGADPFDYLRAWAEKDEKYRWRYALAVALFLHGFSDKTKEDAFGIWDAMNYSFRNKKNMTPEIVNVGKAMTYDIGWKKDRSFRSKVMNHSAFANVFFMALMDYARQRGVVTTASFGWVKAFDRTLWYALSQAGRSVCSVEAAGVWSHYYAEEAMRTVIENPYMEIAIEGLRTEMINEGYLNEKAELARKEEADKAARQEDLKEKQERDNYGAPRDGAKRG